jgi:hypothetical protein
MNKEICTICKKNIATWCYMPGYREFPCCEYDYSEDGYDEDVYDED